MNNKLPSSSASWSGYAPAPSLEELKARRQERREVNKRVDDLKVRLFRLTDGHMDQAVRILRGWLQKDND